jgi:hypothetical protein
MKSFEKSFEHLSEQVWTEAPKHDHQVAVGGLGPRRGTSRPSQGAANLAGQPILDDRWAGPPWANGS